MLAGVWLLYFSFGLTVVAMAPLVGRITDELGLSHSEMGGILGAWPLVYIASAIPCGALLDRVGPRPALLLASLIMALSSVLRGLATDPVSLFLAVAIFGLGGPLISVGAPKVIGIWFQGRDRGLAMGIYVTGPALGGVVALAFTNSVLMPLTGESWRGVLFAYAGFALAAGIAWLAISTRRAARIVERDLAAAPRRRQLDVFLRLVRQAVVRTILLMSVGIFFFNHGLNNWLPEILRVGGMDAAAAGYWAAIPTAIGIVASLLIPRFAIASRRLSILLALFLCAGAASLLLQSQGGMVLAIGLILLGIARGSMMTVAMLALIESRGVDQHNIGAAGGLYFSAAEIGGVLGPLAIGYLSDLSGGFAAALYMLTCVMALLMLLLARLRRLDRGH